MKSSSIYPESAKLPNPVVPTGQVHHSTIVREGKQSAEVFCKNNRRRNELGLPPLPDPETVS